MSQTCLLLPRSLRRTPSTESTPSWTPGVEVAASNTWWIGMASAQRNDHRCPEMTFLIHHYSQTSIDFIPTNLHPEVAAVLDVSRGRREPSVERGGVTVTETPASSGPFTHDHNHLSSNSPHLSHRNQDQYKATITSLLLCLVLKSLHGLLPDSSVL